MVQALTNPGEYYIGKDNTTCYQLKSTACQTGTVAPIDLTPITKMELQVLGARYSSEDYPQVFNWLSDPTNGLVELAIGLLTGISAGLDIEPELILYDPSNLNGVTFRMPAMVVREVK